MSHRRPLILGIETSTDACSVALTGPWPTRQSFELNPRGHAASLLPMIRDLLAQCGVEARQLDALAFAAGPGSFTGLRIAAGVTQGLAFALAKPVIPVSTLAAMAAGVGRRWRSAGQARPVEDCVVASDGASPQACEAWPNESSTAGDDAAELRIVPLLDARMAEVYVGQYRVCRKGQEALSDDRLLPPALVPLPPGGGPLVLAGSGLTYRHLLPPALLEQVTWSVATCYPEALEVAELALSAYHSGVVLPADQAQPIYLRDEVAWQKTSSPTRQAQ